MPDPKKFDSKDDWMGACMHQTKTVEGKPQDQAVAICLSLWREKGEKKASNRITESLDKIADSLEKKGYLKEALEIDDISDKLENM